MDVEKELNSLLNRYPSIGQWVEKIKSRQTSPQLVQSLLPQESGEYLAISGRTGIGKTNLGLHLAFCLATGRHFYSFPCSRVSVVYLALEGDPDNIVERYEKIQSRFPPVEDNLGFELLPKDTPRRLLREIEEKSKGYRVLILDPVKWLVQGDFCKPRDAESFIQYYRGMLQANGQTGIIILPIRKPGNQAQLIYPGDVYSIKGATEYVDSATTVLLLEKKPHSRKDTQVTLYFAKSRIATKELGPMDLEFSYDDCQYSIL